MNGVSNVVFSVVVPTRNRPELLRRAVESICAQNYRWHEIIVVDDGSSETDVGRCREELQALDSRVRLLYLGRHRRGRGPAYARNIGAWAAQGEFLAFLDDDDEWVDPDYLGHAHEALVANSPGGDLLFANQAAVPVSGGAEQLLWLQALAGKLRERGLEPTHGCFPVEVEDLARYQGFCHLNTTIVRRAFFDQLGGFDEYLRYEEDLDFYLRAIDRAAGILHLPDVVARHYVPDPGSVDSASQSLHQEARLACRRQLLAGNLLRARSPALVSYCRKHLAHTNKHLSRSLAGRGRYSRAHWCAREAAAAGASPRWLLYTAYLGVRGLLSREPQGS